MVATTKSAAIIPDSENGADMLSAREAAEHLGVKMSTLYAYVSRGWLKSYRRKVGRQALYRRSEIESLRGVVTPERGRRGRSLPEASSWVTVAQPPRGEGTQPAVIVAESAVSSIIGGRLVYRGYVIEEIAERASFEEVCLLLWQGERPAPEDVEALRSEIFDARMPASAAAALAAVGLDAAPLLRLTAVIPSLGALERSQAPRSRMRQATLLMGVLPLALAQGKINSAADAHGGMAARLLQIARDGGCQDWEVGAVERVLIASAEHELNASTFAARVVASTGADLYACTLAALCSLSGPIHGGSADRIERMFAQLATGARIDACLEGFAREQTLPPGFGHVMYPAGDPRAVLLKEVASKMARRKGRRLFETALRVEDAVWKALRLRPNLDFYLTVCVRMLDFPPGLPSAIFAIGRAAGWIAHCLEQYADNRLIRPRIRYRGPALRHWR
jgi:citrate synthase